MPFLGCGKKEYVSITFLCPSFVSRYKADGLPQAQCLMYGVVQYAASNGIRLQRIAAEPTTVVACLPCLLAGARWAGTGFQFVSPSRRQKRTIEQRGNGIKVYTFRSDIP